LRQTVIAYAGTVNPIFRPDCADEVIFTAHLQRVGLKEGIQLRFFGSQLLQRGMPPQQRNLIEPASLMASAPALEREIHQTAADGRMFQ
jgi:hypothetical protein